jgi:hypothetical protein
MGTRADFYVGRGESAEWLGSIAWDGYPDGVDDAVLKANTETNFKAALDTFFSIREDVTRPEMGWPWPWETSSTTDFAYAFDGGKVYGSCFGGKWYRATSKKLTDDESSNKSAVFPNMKDRQRVTLGKRSGVIVVSTSGMAGYK